MGSNRPSHRLFLHVSRARRRVEGRARFDRQEGLTGRFLPSSPSLRARAKRKGRRRERKQKPGLFLSSSDRAREPRERKEDACMKGNEWRLVSEEKKVETLTSHNLPRHQKVRYLFEGGEKMVLSQALLLGSTG